MCNLTFYYHSYLFCIFTFHFTFFSGKPIVLEVVGSSNTSNGETTSRKMEKRRWTQNEVPFEIDYSEFNSTPIYVIFQAMHELQQYTCLKFRPRKAQDMNFVKIINNEQCTSKIGMMGGEQHVKLNTSTCINRGSIIHELGHAIGFFHEQSRPDRDRYITIIPENIEPGDMHNVKKINNIDTYGLPYDYTSLFHYSGRVMSKNDQISIKTKDPYFQNVIGRTRSLSYYDVNLGNLMYNCSQHCDPGIRCPSYGFLGKDCKCWCPGNRVQMCDGSETIVVQDPEFPTDEFCQTLRRSCVSWNTRGECTDDKTHCPMYCDYCEQLQ